MPVQIRELEIQTHVIDEEAHGLSSDEFAAIIEECIERILDILKEKNEW